MRKSHPSAAPPPAAAVRQNHDRICDQFAEDLNRGKSTSIEHWLAEVPPEERWRLLQDLLGVEVDYRRSKGESPTTAEYLDRFPAEPTVVQAALGQATQKIAPTAHLAVRSSVDADLDATWVGGDPIAAAQAREADPATAVPDFIGPYAVEKLLGKGSFGAVYLGRKANADRPVAIKVLHPSTAENPEVREQFVREADTLEQVNHPGIVHLVERFEADGGRLCLALEYVCGGTLRDRMRQPRTYRQVADVTAALAEALHALHLSGVTHRDVKPENILLDADGKPKLADAGLALPDHAYGEGQQSIAGSLAYMSPEQARGDSHLVDGRADLYSLGVVMYQLLTGRRPFNADETSELLRRIQQVAIKPPRQIDGAIPAELEKICLKATAKDPADRYSTAADFAAELRQFADGNSRKPDRRVLAGILAALSLAGLAFFAFGLDPTPRTTGSQTNVAESEDVLPLVVTEFTVTASRDKSRLVPVEQLQPLRSGDAIHFHAEFSAPAYAKLLWLDATGQVQEFYPREPNGALRDQAPVTRFDSPTALDEGWEPLDPAGFSESAILLVSREPLADLSLPEITLDEEKVAMLASAEKYRANPDGVARVNSPLDETRGLGGRRVQVDDPVLQCLEHLRKQADEVHAIRIPMLFDGP